jgi:hypothetical protein
VTRADVAAELIAIRTEFSRRIDALLVSLASSASAEPIGARAPRGEGTRKERAESDEGGDQTTPRLPR